MIAAASQSRPHTGPRTTASAINVRSVESRSRSGQQFYLFLFDLEISKPRTEPKTAVARNVALGRDRAFQLNLDILIPSLPPLSQPLGLPRLTRRSPAARLWLKDAVTQPEEVRPGFQSLEDNVLLKS